MGEAPGPRVRRPAAASHEAERPGQPIGRARALPPSEPVDEPTAETASVRTDDGEEMVAVRSEDSDEEFIRYLKTFEDLGRLHRLPHHRPARLEARRAAQEAQGGGRRSRSGKWLHQRALEPLTTCISLDYITTIVVALFFGCVVLEPRLLQEGVLLRIH